MRFSARKPAPPQASRASWIVSSAFQVDSGLSAAASVSRSSRSSGVSVRPEKTPSNLRQQLVVGEELRVVLGEAAGSRRRWCLP